MTARVAQPPQCWQPRYAMVDGWRGLAALGVVSYHLGLPQWGEFDLGHACVMMFFVISGYCIAASCESCRVHKISPAAYMWRRIRRIYPPYLFSLCFFAVTRIVKLHSGMGNQISTSLLAWIQNVTMTQWFSLVLHPARHAFDNQTLFVAGYWSLNYEEQFYVVMGLILFTTAYFKKSMLVAITAIMVPAFLWNLYRPLVSHGFFWEYWVAFGLGALVFFRLCKLHDRSKRNLIDLGILALLVFSMCGYYTAHAYAGRWQYSEWIVTSGFALVLILLRRWDARYKASKWMVLSSLGLISYSLYLTHQFNLRSSSIVAAKLISWGFPQYLEFPVRLVLVCAVGAGFWYFCERPFLNQPPVSKSAGYRLEAAA